MKHIAVFGYNPMSVEALKRLDKEHYQIIIIDQNPVQAELAKAHGFTTANVDFRSDNDLKSIGVGHNLDSLFCFLPEDSENVFLTLSARTLDKKLNIVAVVENPGSEEKLFAAGANKVIDPYQICGRKIHELIKRPDISDVFDHTVFGRHDLNLAEITIPENSFLENHHINDLKLNQEYNLILIGVVDKELGEQLNFAIGEKNHRLNAGDILVILGPSREIKAFKKAIGYEKVD